MSEEAAKNQWAIRSFKDLIRTIIAKIVVYEKETPKCRKFLAELKAKLEQVAKDYPKWAISTFTKGNFNLH